MGLDMYLSKKTYVKNWSFHKPEENYSVLVKRGGKKVGHINPEKVSEITEDVGYWRKANAIHNWFVENVQGNEDDCKEYYVSREQLAELRDLCVKVIKSLKGSPTKNVSIKTGWSKKEGDIYEDFPSFTNTEVAEELLPTTSGFFFGGTEYDKWYLESLENTVEIINEALESEEGEFYYSSSW